jgi:carboxyl-terminal processing protease
VDEESLLEPRYFQKGDDFLVVRLPAFELSAAGVDTVIGRMRKHKGVVLDLRGNPGGFTQTVDRLIGGMFQDDLKIYDHVTRNSKTKTIASGRHRDAFTGRLAVMVDSESASASEIFARVIQLEKRAFIVGDLTSGKVMESIQYPHEYSGFSYSISVTVADLIMNDGKSLEHAGVEPDILVLPTALDLATGRDPVLAKAAKLVGTELSPEEAGAIFGKEKR